MTTVDCHDVTFRRIETHAPLLSPLLQRSQVCLKLQLVRYRVYCPIQQAVVCEQPTFGVRVDYRWQVIDMEQE